MFAQCFLQVLNALVDECSDSEDSSSASEGEGCSSRREWPMSMLQRQ